jgi:hypothetical protein
VHAHEAVAAPTVFDLGEAAAQQEAPRVGDDPDVVAVGLQVEDLRAVQQTRAPAAHVVHREDVGCRLRGILHGGGRRGGGAVALADARQRLVHAPAADRLHQVVLGAQRERLHGGVLVRADEHDRRTLGEAVEHGGQLEAVETGHAHVEEQGVERPLRQQPKRLTAAGRAHHVRDRARRPQHASEVVEGRLLVVHGQHGQAAFAHAACASAALRGRLMVTVVPRPTCDSMRRP